MTLIVDTEIGCLFLQYRYGCITQKSKHKKTVLKFGIKSTG